MPTLVPACIFVTRDGHPMIFRDANQVKESGVAAGLWNRHGSVPQWMVRIADSHPAPSSPVTPEKLNAPTYNPDARDLDDEERLVLTCLAQRYLRNDPHLQPLPWTQVAFELSELRPAEKWDWRKAARIVARVRKRLSETYHVTGIMEEKDTPSIGTTINHIVRLPRHPRRFAGSHAGRGSRGRRSGGRPGRVRVLPARRGRR